MAANCVLLHTGQKMPLIGLGTWKSQSGEVRDEGRGGGPLKFLLKKRQCLGEGPFIFPSGASPLLHFRWE